MNVKLQEAMAEIITKTVSSAESAGSFIVEQTPNVIQQLLTWKMTEALFFVGLGVMIGLFGVPFYKLSKFYNERYQTRPRVDYGDAVDFFRHFSFALTICCVISGTLMFFVNIHTALYIWMAPKVYLIEYASRLAK